MCSCRGPSACKQCSRLYKRCSCKQWPCTYTAPCVARTCWEESQTHIAAPLWQRRSTHPARALMHAANAPRRGRSCTDQQHHTPPQHTPTQPRSDTQPPRWKLCSTRSPTRSGPQTARKPARLSSRTGFFFCMMEPDTARRKRLGRTTQPDRCPRCPLHPHSAGEIIHRPGRESTTSTTTAPRPVRATPNSGPHWKPTADPAGSSNHHAHDQTAYAPAARPVHAAPVLVMGKPPGGHCPTHSKPHPARPQISQPEPPRPHRRASEARHSVRHTARHFFKSKAQIRHILAVSHPL